MARASPGCADGKTVYATSDIRRYQLLRLEADADQISGGNSQWDSTQCRTLGRFKNRIFNSRGQRRELDPIVNRVSVPQRGNDDVREAGPFEDAPCASGAEELQMLNVKDRGFESHQ